MTTRVFTTSDLKSAVSVAVNRDRARIAAILAAPEANGRAGLAQNIATTTDQSVEQARAALAAAPTAGAAAGAGEPSQSPATIPTPVIPPTDQPPAASVVGTDDLSNMWDAALKSRGMQIEGRQ